jgi:hypothetical protein
MLLVLFRLLPTLMCATVLTATCLSPQMWSAPCALRSHGPPPLLVLLVPLATALVYVAMRLVLRAQGAILVGLIVGVSGRRGYRLLMVQVLSLLSLLALVLSLALVTLGFAVLLARLLVALLAKVTSASLVLGLVAGILVARLAAVLAVKRRSAVLVLLRRATSSPLGTWLASTGTLLWMMP